MKRIKFIKNSLTLIFSTIVFSLGLNSTTQAYDAKTYSGSLCQAYFGYDETWFHKYARGIFNRSSSYRWISCGVTRDRYGLIGTHGAQIHVIAGSSRRTTCTLSERNTNGTILQSRAASRFGSGYIRLDTSRSKNFRNNARIIFCYVPPQATITSVEIREH